MRYLKATTALFLLLSSAASAQQMEWKPLSPSFGGNPANAGLLLQQAQTQNQYKPKDKSLIELTPEEQFFENLRTRIYAKTTNKIIDDIFDGNIDKPVTIPLDNGATITYEVVGLELIVTLVEDGRTTTFTVPMSY